MPTTVLDFPEVSVGELADGRFTACPKVAEARGKVIVYGRPKLILRLNENVSAGLGFLVCLQPDSLYGIRFKCAPVNDSDFINVHRLLGLRLVDVSNLKLSETSFLGLTRNLPLLRSFTLGAGATDFALRDMSPTLAMRVFQFTGRKIQVSTRGAHNIGQKMPGLLKLSLFRSDLSDEGVQALNHLKLRSLNIGMSRLTDLGVAHLSGMRSLRRLSIHNTGISDAALYFLKSLDHLEFLDISGTATSEIGLQYLYNAKALRMLLLNGVKLTPPVIVSLSRMTQLQMLSLGEQPDAESVAALRKALDRCQIVASHPR
jgi:hypothetical protein